MAEGAYKHLKAMVKAKCLERLLVFYKKHQCSLYLTIAHRPINGIYFSIDTIEDNRNRFSEEAVDC